jgi:hypothetical protein
MRPQREFEIGQEVMYKRQGFYGHYNAKVIGMTKVGEILKRVRIEVLTWNESPLYKKFTANVKPDRIH